MTVMKQKTVCHSKSEGVLTMKRSWLAVAFGTAVALAGCAQTAQDENTNVYKRSGNTINVTDRNELYNEKEYQMAMTRR